MKHRILLIVSLLSIILFSVSLANAQQVTSDSSIEISPTQVITTSGACASGCSMPLCEGVYDTGKKIVVV